MSKQHLQIIVKSVAAAHAEVDIDDKTKIEHDRVIGLCVYSQEQNSLANSSLSLKIDKEEIFPVNTPVHLFAVTPAISLKDSVYKVDEPAKTSKIEGKYVDGGMANSYPYDLRIILITQDQK